MQTPSKGTREYPVTNLRNLLCSSTVKESRTSHKKSVVVLAVKFAKARSAFTSNFDFPQIRVSKSFQENKERITHKGTCVLVSTK